MHGWLVTVEIGERWTLTGRPIGGLFSQSASQSVSMFYFRPMFLYTVFIWRIKNWSHIGTRLVIIVVGATLFVSNRLIIVTGWSKGRSDLGLPFTILGACLPKLAQIHRECKHRFFEDRTVACSIVGYWHDIVDSLVCLSVCLWRSVLWLNDKMSEQVNRKCAICDAKIWRWKLWRWFIAVIIIMFLRL